MYIDYVALCEQQVLLLYHQITGSSENHSPKTDRVADNRQAVGFMCFAADTIPRFVGFVRLVSIELLNTGPERRISSPPAAEMSPIAGMKQKYRGSLREEDSHSEKQLCHAASM